MQFKLPELGEGVYEGEAVRWLVQPGDAVKPGQTLLEVLTDKATMEVPAPFAGVVDKLLVNPGDKIEIGQPILEYQEKAGGKQSAKTEQEKAKPEPESKAKPEPESKSKPEPESKAKAKPEPESKPKPTVTPAPARDNGAVAIKAAPSIRLMARKLGVDLAKIRGSGADGRILIDDLSRHVAPGAAKPAAPPADYGQPGTRVKLAGIRRKIAEHMVKSMQTVPHYGFVDECDVTDLVKLRTSLKEPFAAKGRSRKCRLSTRAWTMKRAKSCCTIIITSASRSPPPPA